MARKPVFGGWDVARRVDAARAKTGQLSSFITTLLQTHANNRVINYSDRFSGQVGRSYAADALADLQRSCFGMELIRLTALWDPPRPQRCSIPTIAGLIADEPVIERLRTDFIGGWGLYQPIEGADAQGFSVEELQALNNRLERDNDARLRRDFDRVLKKAFRVERAVSSSNRLYSLMGHRDRFLAHNLDDVPMDRRGEPYRAPRYGQERRLLMTTLKAANAFSVVINNSSFAYDQSLRFTRSNAEALWRGCELRGIR